MPHKRNPILSENLTGLSRMVRSYVTPALENISLWHERDISHSSVERNIGPDATTTLDFALNRLKNILENMNVYPKNIRRNLEMNHRLVFSQRIMLELTKKGLSREKAYKLVQKHTQISLKNNSSFEENLRKDSIITKKIPVNKLNKLFDFSYHTKRIDIIFRRIFK